MRVARILSSVASSLFLAVPALAQGNGPWTQVCNVSTGGKSSASCLRNECDISSDGRYVAFVSSAALDPADANGWYDVYVRDPRTATTFTASLGQGAVLVDRDSMFPALSSTGRYLAFQSQATNLVPGNDPGFDPDVFVRDLVTGAITRCSIGAGGVEPDDTCPSPTSRPTAAT